MNHIGEVQSCHFDGESFNLACPQRNDSAADGSQREASDPVEETAHRRRELRIVHFATAAIVLVVLTMVCVA